MSLYCDGGFNSFTTPYAWGSVVDEKENDVITPNEDMKIENKQLLGTKKNKFRNVIISKFDDVKSQQNNGAELLAFIYALRLALVDKKYKKIHCDSDLIIKWWSVTGISKSNTKCSEEKKKYVQECMRLRKEFELNGGKVIKIKGKDNIADLGLHKN